MPHQAFISYASDDRAIADRVCRALEDAGIPCWMAPRDIPPGTDYPAAIMDGIRNTTVLVLLLSGAAAESPHILSEVGHAFNERKKIVPFRLSSVALPSKLDYFLSMTQWLDAQDGATDANLERLIAAVQAAVKGEPEPEHRKRLLRSKLVIGGAAAALLLSAAGAAYWMNIPRTKPGVETPPVTSDPGKAEPENRKEPAPLAKTPASWVNPADGQTYLWIPPGKFAMGCSPSDDQCGPDEKPAHTVQIAQGFWLARTEVTVAAFRAYAARHKLEPPAGDANLPVTRVSWDEAKKYCAAVGGRLPAEAEWEYAARGGVAQSYYGDPSEIAWHAGNSGERLHPVQTKAPNAFGLYDMLGNAGEWVLDRYYNKYYLDAPATGPKIDQPLAGNAMATARGGFFAGDLEMIRVSRRAPMEHDQPSEAVGFRCAAVHPAP